MTGRLLPLVAMILGSLPVVARASEVSAGRAVYRDGKVASGGALRGILEGDVEVRGAAASCARCHRPSGFGSNEGTSIVPAITGPSLFRPRQARRADLIRGLYQAPIPEAAQAAARTPRDRPAYTDRSLAEALRRGIDPTGRVLDPLMPRYELGDDDMRSLIAYMRTLSAEREPGVDDRNLHLATVVSAGVDPARRRALLSVVEAFVRARNLDIRRTRDRPGFSIHFKGEYRDALRDWVLHVWELDGPAETWGAQLDAHQRRQPVFAMVSGLVDAGWRPLHDFSARSGVPCLFPVTGLPVLDDVADSPTIYLSRGLTVEAESLGSWLSEPGHLPADARVVQVYRPTESGTTLASSFRRAFGHDLRSRLTDERLPRDEPQAVATWYRSIARRPPTVMVLWLTAADLATLPSPDRLPRGVDVYLSGGILEGDLASVPRPWYDRVRLTYPYAIPGREEPQIYRARAWLRSRKVEPGPERVQLSAFVAMSLLDHALGRMVDHFSRDYLVECVEHEAENAMNPGLFPRMSLGPGQRFASKGCAIVSAHRDVSGGLIVVSPWIIP